MSEKRYTAQEMREVAGSLDAGVYRGDPASMLRQAAGVVERCEKMRSDIMSRTYKHDIGWMGGDDKAVYSALGDVLRGDAGKEENI